jgi:hypothetical protein
MRTLPSRLAALFGALALLLGWLAADLMARRVSIAAELQYLPPTTAGSLPPAACGAYGPPSTTTSAR